jgi:hypothetical protein
MRVAPTSPAVLSSAEIPASLKISVSSFWTDRARQLWSSREIGMRAASPTGSARPAEQCPNRQSRLY